VADSNAPSWAELLKPNGWKSERVFLVFCLRPQQLAHVGWFLFTLISKICAVLFPRLVEQRLGRAHIRNPPPRNA
jgi:hypothetical protein